MQRLASLLAAALLIGCNSSPGAEPTAAADDGTSDSAADGYDTADGADGSNPDGADGSDGADGTEAADGSEAADASDGIEPACAPRIEHTLLPAFGRASTSVALGNGFVAVATALGLETYSAAVGASPLGWLELDGVATHVSVSGARAAVAQGKQGVTLVDLSDPAHPVRLGWVRSFGFATGVKLTADRLYVADGVGGIRIWDVANPASPIALGGLDLDDDAYGVDVIGDAVYVAARTQGLVVVDVSDVTAPVVLAVRETNGDAFRVVLAGGRAYVAANYGGVRIFDTSDPLAPTAVGAYWLGGNMIVAKDVAVDPTGETIYVADFWHALLVVDVSNAAAPFLLGQYTTSGDAFGVAGANGGAWLAGGTLRQFDVSGATPALIHTVGALPGEAATDLRELDGSIYLAEGSAGVRVVQPQGDGPPMVLGQYATAFPATAVEARDTMVFVGLQIPGSWSWTSELELVDMTDLAAASSLSKTALPHPIHQIRYVGDDVLYVTTGALTIIDVADPTAPKMLGSLSIAAGAADDLDVQGDVLAVTERYGEVGFWDISDRRSPVRKGGFATPWAQNAVALSGNTAFVADGPRGVHVLDISNISDPKELSTLTLPFPVTGLSAAGGTLWLATGGQIAAFDSSDPTRLAPLAALSLGGSPARIRAVGGVAYVADRLEPLAVLHVECSPTPSTLAPVNAPTPGTQWVNLISDVAALDVVSDGTSTVVGLGYAQGTEPAPAPATATFELDAKAVATAADVGDELIIAVGTTGDAHLVRAPRLGPPPADRTRLRVIHTAPGESSVRAFVRSGSRRWDLGGPGFAQHAPALDLDASAELELSVVMEGETLVTALPVLAGGHAVDAIVTRTAEGRLFVLLQSDDGLTRQVGAPDHTTQWRVGNFLGVPIAIVLEAEASPVLARIDTGNTGQIGTFWPGTKQAIVENADTGEVLGVIPALALEAQTLHTTALFWDASGALGVVTLEDFSGQSTGNETTEFQLIHIAPDLGPVDLTLIREAHYDGTAAATLPFAEGLGLGDVTPQKHPKSGSYRVGVDLDRDGTPEKIFNIGYTADYGHNLFLGRDGIGRLVLGIQSPAESPIYWHYADDELSSVRVLNLTGKGLLEIGITTWYGQGGNQSLGNGQTSYNYQVFAGMNDISVSDLGAQKTWTWTGSLETGHRYTIAFWVDGAGKVQSFATDDTVQGLRVINVAPTVGSVQAAFALTPGSNLKSLGTLAPGSTSALVQAGFTSTAPGHLMVDRDGDGDTDLTFNLSGAAYDMATNVFLVEDATWPYVLIQGQDYSVTLAYAEELQARLRVVFLASEASSLNLAIDGVASESVWAKPAYGADVEAFYSASSHRSLLAGDHELRVTVAGVEKVLPVVLPGMSRHTLLVYGPKDAPTVALLDDTGLAGSDGSTVTVFHAAPGAGAVDVAVYPDGEADPSWIAEGVSYGTTSSLVPLDGAAAAFGIDRDQDGTLDWKTTPGSGATGHHWVFVTGTAEEPALFVVGEGAYAWLGGETLP